LDIDDIPIIANEDINDSNGSYMEILDGGSDADTLQAIQILPLIGPTLPVNSPP